MKRKDLESYLIKEGYNFTRSKGSHYQYTKPSCRSVTLIRTKADLTDNYLAMVCHELGVTKKELIKRMNQK